ncbi:MAG: tRNA (adenosine(37)-N6)-threonylcarbamoyltransferase complex ATPase subunit type 1 TsaE [Coriobacteriia bacterium]|nr:tRNA (adenosine(37)-N6)-threonylcarbamoyltransferase complex ATPase subunit type 1 TsaE [Coriobacteriia bacterium]MBN2839671.1 tRNA (adenosine(37)-N6)-threonylcarbamoyltransferase complex ATPase subunit type 1 TsaE [Coriobacteriia bacterium]
MDHVFTTGDAGETDRAGALLAACLEPGDVVALSGDLGAGKTHLVQGVARALDVDGAVTSPTFNILLVHDGVLPLYHFDLYRLEDEAQLEDVGFFEMLEADGASFIEWGDRFPDALPPDHLLVTIQRSGDTGRVFTLHPGGVRARVLADCWIAAIKAGASG